MPQDERQDQPLDVVPSATTLEAPGVTGMDGFAPPLGDMSSEEFRRYGRSLVDWIAEYFERVDELPVLAQVEPGALIAKLPAAPPEAGEPMDRILADVDRLVVPALTQWRHPGFFAYFACSTSAPGIFGELLAAAFNGNALLWRAAPAAQELEDVALSWLRQMIGLPEAFSGMIYDTASISTLHAIAAAREGLDLRVREDGMSGRTGLPLLRVYASEQAHSSVEKCAITLGLGQRSLHKIPTDAEFRMDVAALTRAIKEDKAAGHLPFCVVATVGTTSTSSIDPVPAIADLCERERLWLHVDAAYAGSAAVVPELRHILAGCERADSLVLNPVKWLFVPFDFSALYTRRMDMLHRAFSLVPEYLRTLDHGHDAVRNHSEYGIQLGRRFRGLKFWMVLRYFGHDGLAARIREHCRLARLFASVGRGRARLGTARSRSPEPGLLPRLLDARWRDSRRARRPPRSLERADHARPQCVRRGVPLAHEAQRPLHHAPSRRQYPHHRGACRTRVADPGRRMRAARRCRQGLRGLHIIGHVGGMRRD